jgi:hypothetical protein
LNETNKSKEKIKLMLAWGKNHINFHIGNPMQFKIEDGFHRSGI